MGDSLSEVESAIYLVIYINIFILYHAIISLFMHLFATIYLYYGNYQNRTKNYQTK